MLTIDLNGRTSLVVGGSRGIGAGIVEALALAGSRTVLTHTGRPEHAERLDAFLARLQDAGASVEAVVCDACDAEATRQAVDDLAGRAGRLDVLVANVGQNLARPVEEATVEQWRGFMEVNLSSAFYAVKAALPHMVRAGYGKIVLIGSSAVYDGGGGAVDYAAGKAGLDGMMKYLARNYARKGVRTNVIHPCVIDTDLLRQRYDDEAKRAALAEQVPVRRLGKPADIGNLTAYLASPHGDFLCGQSMLVDGGRTFFR